jgi:RNA polymerase sigma-70 factor (ECF subfamily)
MDTTRFERLLTPHHDAALAFARCLCRSRADGDDLFQIALVRALDHLDGLRDEAAFKSWLYRIIVTSHRNTIRSSFWRRLVPFADHEPRATADEPVDEALGGDQRVGRALGSLPAEQREAIVLFEIEGWTVEHIADLQQCSVSAVKSRLARGRERLRHVYIHRLGGEAPAALPAPEGTP